ncbi:hypothetical protein OBBRIDRAFT_90339 [Obba rivulosa]|uniref:Uncharacterized protein n=1 Tax=Obba rivulosa TaxID=1052685 RepID=A0A8E2AZK2_9APHY|nr:hypothetical protein OBBRIDRAFT_90339 [Obba rivulosa]
MFGVHASRISRGWEKQAQTLGKVASKDHSERMHTLELERYTSSPRLCTPVTFTNFRGKRGRTCHVAQRNHGPAPASAQQLWVSTLLCTAQGYARCWKGIAEKLGRSLMAESAQTRQDKPAESPPLTPGRRRRSPSRSMFARHVAGGTPIAWLSGSDSAGLTRPPLSLAKTAQTALFKLSYPCVG